MIIFVSNKYQYIFHNLSVCILRTACILLRYRLYKEEQERKIQEESLLNQVSIFLSPFINPFLWLTNSNLNGNDDIQSHNSITISESISTNKSGNDMDSLLTNTSSNQKGNNHTIHLSSGNGSSSDQKSRHSLNNNTSTSHKRRHERDKRKDFPSKYENNQNEQVIVDVRDIAPPIYDTEGRKISADTNSEIIINEEVKSQNSYLFQNKTPSIIHNSTSIYEPNNHGNNSENSKKGLIFRDDNDNKKENAIKAAIKTVLVSQHSVIDPISKMDTTLIDDNKSIDKDSFVSFVDSITKSGAL